MRMPPSISSLVLSALLAMSAPVFADEAEPEAADQTLIAQPVGALPDVLAVALGGDGNAPRLFVLRQAYDIRGRSTATYAEQWPVAEPAPAQLTGARNGAFTATILVATRSPAKNLTVEPSALTMKDGGDSIPASHVEVKFALADGSGKRVNLPIDGFETETLLHGTLRGEQVRSQRFDTLSDTPADNATAHYLWVTVRVPAETAAGDYEGTLSIRAEGAPSLSTPLRLRVADWTLPDPRDFDTFADLIQSPESVALHYKTPLWSDAHFDKLRPSLELIGQAGGRSLYLRLINLTHFGNTQTIVRWIAPEKEGAPYTHDFSVMERYTDLFVEHVGIPDVACLYAWERRLGGGYHGKVRGQQDPPEVSLLDPQTGEVTTMKGPILGTPEAEAFWRPVFEGVFARLRERGVPDEAIMLGLAGDAIPSPKVTEMFTRLAPDSKWVTHAHGNTRRMRDRQVGFLAHVWGGRRVPDPASKRLYGWQNDWIETVFPRPRPNPIGRMSPMVDLAVHRLIMEAMLGAGYRGFGRVGADFWNVVDVGRRGRRGSILARYSWHQLSVGNSSASILAAGPEGAIPTVRHEMIRLGVQEAQARIFIEKALTAPETKEQLGAALAEQAQALLDERTRAYIDARHEKECYGWFAQSGWEDRNAQLFLMAAKIDDGTL